LTEIVMPFLQALVAFLLLYLLYLLLDDGGPRPARH
jgi:hypothetical protein